MPSDALKKLRAAQAPTNASSTGGGSSVLAELRKGKAAPVAEPVKKTSAPTVPGPRKALVQEKPKEVIKAPGKTIVDTVKTVTKKAAGSALNNLITSVIGGPAINALPAPIKVAVGKKLGIVGDEAKVVEAAKTGTQMGVDQYKRLVGRASTLVSDLVKNDFKPSKKNTKNALDLGSSLILDAGGAIFNAALEVLGSSPLGNVGKQNLSKAIETVSKVGGGAASFASKAIPMDDATRKQLDPSIREFGGAITIAAVFGLAVKAGSKLSRVDHFANTVGIDPVTRPDGSVREVSLEEVARAFEKTAEEVVRSGENVEAKMDVLKAGEAVMRKYAELGPERFEQEVSPYIASLEQKADQVWSGVAELANDGVIQTKTDAVETVLRQPATPQTRKIAQNFDQDMQLAFEQELFDLNAKNDPGLAQAAEGEGLKYERFEDEFDSRPAYYDVRTGTIRLNEATIKRSLDAVWQGKILKIGEGTLVSTFRKLANETFEGMKTRYEKELLKHEAAHAKTISPEDVARFDAAIRSGDKVAAEKMRVELEEKASKFVVEKADSLSPEIDRSLDAEIARKQSIETAKERIKATEFTDASREASYRSWKKIVQSNEKYKGLDFESFRKELERSPAYRGKSIEALFEKGLDRGDAATGVTRFDDLFDKFNERFSKERAIREEYKRAKAEQRTLFPEAEKMDQKTRTAIRRAIRSELREGKLEGKVRTLELGKLRERIRGRLEKEVQREKFDKMTTKQRERQSRKEKRRQIEGLLKRNRPERTKGGQLKGKGVAETQAILDKIERITKMDRNLAISEAMGEVMRWREANPRDIQIPEELALMVDIAETAGLRRQSLEQLKRTEAFIRSVTEEGRSKRKDILQRQQVEQEKIRANALTELTGDSKGLPPETFRKLEGSWGSKLKNGFLAFIRWDTATMSEFAKALGRNAEGLMRDTTNSVERVRQHLAKKHQTVESIGREIYGRGYEKQYFSSMRKQADLGQARFADGKMGPVRVSRLEAMKIYSSLKDQGFMKNLMSPEGNAWTREILDKVLSVLDLRDKQFIERVTEETYRAQYERFRTAVSEKNGIALGKVEGYAGPLRYEEAMNIKLEETPIDILTDGIRRRLGMTSTGIQSRVGFTGKMRLSADPVMDAMNYVRQTEHYIQVAGLMSHWDAIMKDGELHRASDAKYGDSFWSNLSLHVGDLREGAIVKEKQIISNRWLTNRQGDVAGALIARPSVWMGQFSSIAQFRAEAKRGGAFWKGVKNFKETLPLLREYAPAVEARTLNSVAEYVSAFEGERGPIRRGIEKAKSTFAVPLELADKVTTVLGASGIFNDRVELYQERGISLEESRTLAGKDIADIITRTQSTRSYLGKSNFEKRTGYGQILSTLRNQPNKIARALPNAIIDFRKGKMTRKQLASFIYWNNVVQPAMYYTLRHGTKLALGGVGAALLASMGDEEGAEEAWADAKGSGFTRGVAYNMANNATGFLGIGDFINLVIENGLLGKNYEYRPSVVQALGEDIVQAAVQFHSGDWDEATVLMVRATSRANGIGDPGDFLKLLLNSMSAKNKVKKDEARKTPQARAAARRAKLLKRANKK